jgi:hypothetical protein
MGWTKEAICKRGHTLEGPHVYVGKQRRYVKSVGAEVEFDRRDCRKCREERAAVAAGNRCQLSIAFR